MGCQSTVKWNSIAFSFLLLMLIFILFCLDPFNLNLLYLSPKTLKILNHRILFLNFKILFCAARSAFAIKKTKLLKTVFRNCHLSH